MKKITAALILMVQVHLAGAAPELIDMAANENYFSADFVAALKPLTKEQINEQRDILGRSILHILAIRSHQARALPALLAGADANAKDNDGRNPLFDVLEAADPDSKGNADIMLVEMLTLRGADVNARARDGSTPLLIAVQQNDLIKAAFLLRHGANPAPKEAAPGKSPLAIAQAGKNARLAELLSAAAAKAQLAPDVERKPAEPPKADEVAKALTAVNLDAIEGFVAAGWNINEQNDKGQTALFRAVDACRPDLVTELLFLGADPNIGDTNGKTPLMVSMRYLGIEGQRVTAALLLKGADANAKTKDGQTALTAAASAGHDFGVKWLVSAGADPLAPTPKGPLVEYATHSPTISLLQHYGLPEKKPKPPETDPVVLTLNAIRKGDLKAVEQSLANGVSVSDLDKKDGNVVSLAAYFGQFEIVDLLVKNGADINRQSPNGWHALHGFAGWGPAQGDPKVAATNIEQMLKRGANPDLPANDGNTALMMAAKQGIKEANTEALLKGGASLTVRNKEGLTALGVAKKNGRTEMAEYLQSLGAKE